jgi:Protein of unknown function (DUF1553)/Protein of unknown function (DUF1549)/Concanavalin A-like lectin/glucanases superfamily/Planctomycete cytochrome C
MTQRRVFQVSSLSLVIALVLTGVVVSVRAQEPVPSSSTAALPATIQFNRDIRPILSDKCFTCHGPDKGKRVTQFHFDVEEAAKQPLPGGRFAVLAGDTEKSALIQRITATDDRRRMPPVSTGKALTGREIALLTAWIQQGAKWEKPWAFESPLRPNVPQVADRAWPRNAIDSFVLARLEQQGIKPSPEADRATLLRRVTLDLIGKGPTLEEIDAFVADKSPNAYEKVVDRLLRSPHYGERMAMPWLDASRYADSSGYQVDYERSMWRWRDWVIDAFNKNMPFDQFAVEQLAGDLLPNATLDQKIATAFNRNHRTNAEGGIVLEEYATEYVVDRVATTSSVFLGVTMGCARCHDHKYDPFTQKEFYQLYAYFNNVPEHGRSRRGNSQPYIKAPTATERAELDKLDAAVIAAASNFEKARLASVAAEAKWIAALAHKAPSQWAPPGQVAYYSMDTDLPAQVSPAAVGPGKTVASPSWQGTAQFAEGIVGRAASFDGKSYIDAGAVGEFDDEAAFTFSAWINPTRPTGAIVTKTRDESESRGYTLQLKDGKVQISVVYGWAFNGVRIETEKPLELGKWHHVSASYDGSREARGLTLIVDGVRQPSKVQVDVLNDPPTTREPLRIGGGGGPENRFQGLIDEVRIYDRVLTDDEVAVLFSTRPLNEIAQGAEGERTAPEQAKVRGAFLESPDAPEALRQASRRLSDVRKKRDAYYGGITTVMVMQEMPTPRETHVLLRGAYDQFGETVAPDVPSILPPIPKEYPRNRLGLARWLVQPSNPLTARVAVNRYWQLYFGSGIVKTVEDFGSQGEPPSHPELLDWLATEFVRTGWNIKEFQKLIVMSATYRQDSQASAAALQKDPENRLLARGPRFRLPAETVRDQALAVAGLLVEKVGGPSVKPYQPEGLWLDLTQNGSGEYVQDRGDKLYRRSLYTFWKRTIPPPTMANFDAPSRESAVLQRSVTNTPLQALNLLNDVTYLEAARVLAERMLREGGPTPANRIAFAFRLATGQRPTATESEILANALAYAHERFAGRPDAAAKFLAVGEHPRDQKLDVKDLASYASVASVILNMDKTITKD